MHRFIYASSADPAMDLATLDDIGTVAKARNQQDGLTGMLFWTNGAFLQMLEGHKPQLDKTIARIENDPRHSIMRELSYEPIADLTCAEWRMECFTSSSLRLPFGLENATGAYAVLQRLSAVPTMRLNEFFGDFYKHKVSRV